MLGQDVDGPVGLCSDACRGSSSRGRGCWTRWAEREADRSRGRLRPLSDQRRLTQAAKAGSARSRPTDGQQPVCLGELRKQGIPLLQADVRRKRRPAQAGEPVDDGGAERRPNLGRGSLIQACPRDPRRPPVTSDSSCRMSSGSSNVSESRRSGRGGMAVRRERGEGEPLRRRPPFVLALPADADPLGCLPPARLAHRLT